MLKRFLVLDCWISRVNMAAAVDDVLKRTDSGEGGYVCFSNVHSVVASRHDLRLRDITNESFMSMPDGKPIEVVGKWLGVDGISKVSGPDFMVEFMQKTSGSRHYLYGATEQTLASLAESLKGAVPGLNIVGCHAPPFRDLTEEEEFCVIQSLQEARPDYIWVGIGAPRQEYWMSRHWQSLRPAILFGVGAAFDFHAGVKTRAPLWMRSAGLEWLHRLASEPRRLWRRYLVTNSIFILVTAKILIKRRFSGGAE